MLQLAVATIMAALRVAMATTALEGSHWCQKLTQLLFQPYSTQTLDPGFQQTFNRHMNLTRAAALGISGWRGWRLLIGVGGTYRQPNWAQCMERQVNAKQTFQASSPPPHTPHPPPHPPTAVDRTTQLMWRFSDGELPRKNFPKVD